jgi:anti-sigma regulatory factor (Ser/Thr protein kinase)
MASLSPQHPTVMLEVASRAENLTLVRGMLGGVAELLGFDPELLDDLKTAVSEACNNVVLHAYGGEAGPLAVALYVNPESIEVAVRDHGSGMGQLTPIDDRMQGIGLPVIQALAQEADFRRGADGGTEVWMVFAGRRDGHPLFGPSAPSTADDGWTASLSGDAIASVSPVALLNGVLGRLARALAATARFSLDRFSDVYLVTDAIGALARRCSSADRIGFSLEAESRRLSMTIGPFRAGTQQLLSGDDPAVGANSPLALLSDELSCERAAADERLNVLMIDHR